MAAKESTMGDIHEEVAQSILMDLKAEDHQIRRAARADAIKFLKDNKIEADPAQNQLLADIHKNLPFPLRDDEDEAAEG